MEPEASLKRSCLVAHGESGRMATVVVLGMHRSGTSAVAAMLTYMGVRMGPRNARPDWIGGNWSNPLGHYENIEFVRLCEKALGVTGSGVRPPDAWEQNLEKFDRGEVQRLIGSSADGLWGWKTPWTVLTLPLFLPYLRDARFVIVERDPAEVADSLHRRDRVPIEDALKTVAIYAEQLRSLLERYPEVREHAIRLTYEYVTANPKGAASDLAAFLSLPVSPEMLERIAHDLVLDPPRLKRIAKRLAFWELATFPKWIGWLVRQYVGQRYRPRSIVAEVWNELVSTFQTATRPD